jgi:hypothetical protein
MNPSIGLEVCILITLEKKFERKSGYSLEHILAEVDVSFKSTM